MKFTEQKAKDVVEQFSLSEKTIAVWRMRGSIPDKYFKGHYQVQESIKERVHDKVIKILSSEKINVSALAQRSGLSYQKLIDAARGKSTLGAQDYTSLRVALNTIRIEIKKLVESYRTKDKFYDRETEALKKFLRNTPEIVITKVFDDKKLIDWKNGKPVIMRPEDYRKAVDSLSIFILETSTPEK